MAKKKKKNPVRLFHEKWKWYFVNAYIIIGLALIISLISLHLFTANTKTEVAEQIEKTAVKVEVDTQETKLEIVEEALVEEEIVDVVVSDPTPKAEPKSIVLVNANSITDRVAASLLIELKKARVFEVEKEFDSALIEKITELGLEETQYVYIIGGGYVVSADSEAKITGLNNVEVFRLSGSNMQSTGVAVINHINGEIDFSHVYITNASLAENARQSIALVKEKGIPVYFVDYSGLSKVVKDSLINNKVKQVEIIGSGLGSKTISQIEAIVGAGNVKK